jgi:hypothetical protein
MGKTKARAAACLLTGAAAIGSLGAFVPAASAAPGQTAKGLTITLDFSANPSTTLEPPSPPFAPLTIPANCPFDTGAVFTVTGNAVGHGVTNNNGAWFGQTIEGAATLADGDASPIYAGHLTGWTGFGTNMNQSDATGQIETGLTLDFEGVSTTDPSNTLDVHIDWQGTQNNNGTVTAMLEHFTCS